MSQEETISNLQRVLREMQSAGSVASRLLAETRDENRRLRDACRSTNRGITRLSKRCQSQAKKIAELKGLLRIARASLSEHGDPCPALCAEIDIALHGRRPAEKAT